MARSTRPFIGINADFCAASKQTAAHARLHAGYFDSILGAGGLPVILPPLGRETEINAFLDRVDGVVLGGGLDMDPKRQQLPSHPAVRPMAERREVSDLILARCVVQRQTPLLAIGTGMQELNAVCGGSLYLHLPEEPARALPHHDPSGGPHRHAVYLEPRTRMEEIYGAGEIRVNSCHHQAVRQVGANLCIGGRAPDGIIEAIEADDPNWFCVGVQWHPESETASALDMQLFECFVQACARRAQPLSLAA